MMMSALGQKRTFTGLRSMSALPPKADIADHDCHVRFVPKADITRSFRKAKNGEMVRAHRWSEPSRAQVSSKVELEQIDSVRAPDAGSIGVRKLGGPVSASAQWNGVS
jgi:hypothetical protein